MAAIWVESFKGGLDSRRLPESSPSGSLALLQDGHINRGGEIEQRAAFVPTYQLPAGLTQGMAYAGPQITVFGEKAAPAGLPVGVSYQQLVHPLDVNQRLARVLSFEYFAGSIYAIAQFEDGGIYHYYGGARVTDWNDKRSRTSVILTGGLAGGFVSSITVGGVEILGATVNYTGDVASTTAAIVDQINAYLSAPDYVAAAFLGRVAILAAADGIAPNGLAVVVTATNVSYVGTGAMAGGLAEPGKIASASFTVGGAGNVPSIMVNGVEVLGQTVTFATDAKTTAAAVAAQITAFASSPDYTATSSGAVVTVVPVGAGAAPNGFTIVATGNLISAPTVFAGGADATYQSGPYVRTGDQKLFCLTGGELHFSGLAAPTKWFSILNYAQGATGAGFVALSDAASNADTLTAVAPYQNYYAVFSPRTVQVEYNDPDPSLSKRVQVLSNTGTLSPRSVVQYGDSDVFYLDESGVRSLKARDASNAAASTDIGVPIDTLVIAALEALTDGQRDDIIGLVEPSSGRYWLAIENTIYVFSAFVEASINAWSTYTLPFAVEEMFVKPLDRKVYVRSGDTIYVYGGQGRAPIYDDTPVVAWLPFMDNGHPSEVKKFEGYDIACRGVWEVRAAQEVANQDASDVCGRVEGTTFNGPGMFGVGDFTHISMRFKSQGALPNGKPAVLSSVRVGYSGDASDAA